MDATFYSSADDVRKLHKTFTEIVTKQIYLLEDVDITKPSLIVTRFEGYQRANYVYIPEFSRYYYVSSPVILSNERIRYDCTVDLLTTHKTEIENLTCLVERQEFAYTPNMVDDKLPLRSERKLQFLQFDSTPFTNGTTLNNNSYCFALTVTGGA